MRHQYEANTDVVHTERTAICPSCGASTTFRYVGDQQWPESVAAAAGMPPIVRLWMCNLCSTTLIESDLLF